MAATESTRMEPDALASLEERILRAVDLVNQLRQERETAEKLAEAYSSDKDSALAALADSKAENQRLNQELESLRADRSQVRARIEKLLGQLDNLAE